MMKVVMKAKAGRADEHGRPLRVRPLDPDPRLYGLSRRASVRVATNRVVPISG